MKVINNNFILRIAVPIIFLSHSLNGILKGNDVKNFGQLFLMKLVFPLLS